MTIRFQPIASAPPLRQRVFKVSSSNRFETVVGFLTKKLTAAAAVNEAAQINAASAAADGPASPKGKGGKAAQEGTAIPRVKTEPEGEVNRLPVQVFCYVNSVFAPALDEGVGGLWKVSLPYSSLIELGRGDVDTG